LDEGGMKTFLEGRLDAAAAEVLAASNIVFQGSREHFAF
jgi:hypothetical protein